MQDYMGHKNPRHTAHYSRWPRQCRRSKKGATAAISPERRE
jgi:hypothetical protein